ATYSQRWSFFGGSQVAASAAPFCRFRLASTASRFSGSLANSRRVSSLQLAAPVCHASDSATTWSMSTVLCVRSKLTDSRRCGAVRAARSLAPAGGAGLPRVGQRHHVVDVDGAVRAIEAHGLAAVRGGERAQQHHAPARAGFQRDLVEVAAQDLVAGVAAVL